MQNYKKKVQSELSKSTFLLSNMLNFIYSCGLFVLNIKPINVKPPSVITCF